MADLTKKIAKYSNNIDVDMVKDVSTNKENEVKKSHYIKFMHRFKNAV